MNVAMTEKMTARIKAEMKNKGMTMSSLADVLGFKSKGHISAAINGKRNIEEKYFDQMAKAFEVRKEYLLGRDSYRTEHDLIVALSGADAALAVKNEKIFNAITGLFELLGIKISFVPVAVFMLNKKFPGRPPYFPRAYRGTTKNECKQLENYIADPSGKWKDFYNAAYRFANMTDEEVEALYNKPSLLEKAFTMSVEEIRSYHSPTINGYNIDLEYRFVLKEVPPGSSAMINAAGMLASSDSRTPIAKRTFFPYHIEVMAKITFEDGSEQYLSAAHLSDVVTTFVDSSSSLIRNMLGLSDILKDPSPVC